MSINKSCDHSRRLRRALESFRTYLRGRGLRLTRQRRAVLGACVRHAGHFDAEDLCQSLARREGGVSRATVYRTLGLLEDGGLLREVPGRDGRACYEPTLTGEHHDHMLCVRCGRVIEFYDERIERLQDQICRERGFLPRDHRMGIRGVCAECREAE